MTNQFISPGLNQAQLVGVNQSVLKYPFQSRTSIVLIDIHNGRQFQVVRNYSISPPQSTVHKPARCGIIYSTTL